MFFNEKADWNEIVPEINCPGTRSSSVMWYTVVCSGTWLSISRVGNFSTCSFHGRLHQEKEGRKLKVIGPAPRQLRTSFLLYLLNCVGPIM